MSRAEKASISAITKAIPNCYSFAQLGRVLGYSPNSGSQAWLAKRVRRTGLDISHFTGKSLNSYRPMVKKSAPDRLILRDENSLRVAGAILRRAMLSVGREYKCEGLHGSIKTVWQEKFLVLHVDHHNGQVYDNRIENLRFLCPNCHSQTETYGNKKTGVAIETLIQLIKSNGIPERKKRKTPAKTQNEMMLRIEKNKPIVRLLMLSSINFSKLGWVENAAKVIGIKPQKVGLWMKRNAPDFYAQSCFKRKSNHVGESIGDIAERLSD